MSKISSVGGARYELEQDSLDLDAFIGLVNDLLPRYIPESSAEKAMVSVRLVRYFQTQGLLDEPFKEGREARYGARHLLQLLAVRRLMASGYSTNSLFNLLRGVSDDALQRLIEGETPRVESNAQPAAPPPSNAALDFLAGIRSRGEASSRMPAQVPAAVPAPAPVPAPSATETNWTRTELATGLELNVRADFQAPQSPHERDVLIEAFKRALESLSGAALRKRRR